LLEEGDAQQHMLSCIFYILSSLQLNYRALLLLIEDQKTHFARPIGDRSLVVSKHRLETAKAIKENKANEQQPKDKPTRAYYFLSEWWCGWHVKESLGTSMNGRASFLGFLGILL
jgi:hypothetical protein